MRVRWFMETMYQGMWDQVRVQFTPTDQLPAPPQELLFEHFCQAVLANMKGAGKVKIYDFDPSEDAQTMSIFEGGEGKEYLELYMSEKLLTNSETVKPNEVGA
jgi:hypothetical protein